MSLDNPPSDAADRYRLDVLLESTATADLFQASHPRLPGRFAVKVLKPATQTTAAALEQFRNEVERAAALRHPHILQVFEVGATTDGAPCVVAELPDGHFLARRLVDGPVPLLEALRHITAIAGALEAAHLHGLVHGSLSAESVFLATFPGEDLGFAKLLDFGMAGLRGPAIDSGPLTIEAARGLAPEQIDARLLGVDARTDQFALAALAYRMLSGFEAFRGDDARAVLHQVVHTVPRPLPAWMGAPAQELEQVLLRGLAKAKEDRFESTLAFARALNAAANAHTNASASNGRAPTLLFTMGGGEPSDEPSAVIHKLPNGLPETRSQAATISFSAKAAAAMSSSAAASPGPRPVGARVATPTPTPAKTHAREARPPEPTPEPILDARPPGAAHFDTGQDDVVDDLAAGFFAAGDGASAVRGTSASVALAQIPRPFWRRKAVAGGAALAGAALIALVSWRISKGPASEPEPAYGGFDSPVIAAESAAAAKAPLQQTVAETALQQPVAQTAPTPKPAADPVPAPKAAPPETPRPTVAVPPAPEPVPPPTTLSRRPQAEKPRRLDRSMVWSEREHRLVPALPAR